MTTRILLFLTIAINICLTQAAPPANTPDVAAATKKLGVFVGKWQSEGNFFETGYSRAGHVTSQVNCRWSPQGNFLVCEQQITDNEGQHTQLSIYSYSSKDGNYTISSMAGPGTQPWNGTMNISGNIWTYPGGFEAKGKKVEIRTINDFSTSGVEQFKSEYSDDGGVHWTIMLQGTARRIAE
jgi:hypothetical protein